MKKPYRLDSACGDFSITHHAGAWWLQRHEGGGSCRQLPTLAAVAETTSAFGGYEDLVLAVFRLPIAILEV